MTARDVQARTARLWGALASRSACRAGGRRAALVALLAACFALRFGLACVLPNIHQADEVYQVAEQANRSIRGFGIVSWEFQTSSRPALLAAMVWPIYALKAPAAVEQLLAAALFSAFSLIAVWAAFRWAEEIYGLGGALVAGAMMGTWFELVYFAPKATADAVCSEFFLAALFLGRPAAGARSLLLAGFSLMLALGLRVQILPAIVVVLALLALVPGRQRIPTLLAGAGIGLAVVGGVEWAWWGTPFQGHVGYLWMEFTRHASAYYGREPVTFFLKNAVLIYGGLLPVIAVLAAAGARRAPVLLLSFLLLVVPFHVIGHKEYRFMVPAIPVMVLLMGLGATAALERLAVPFTARTAVLASLAWLVAMIAMSVGDTYRPFWLRDRNHIFAFREIGRQPDACGVGLEGIRWWHTPGYSGLGADIPIYEIGDIDQLAALAPAATYILAAGKAPPPPPPYVRWREYSRPVEYVYRRPGGCVPDPTAKIERPPVPVSAR